MLNKHWKIIIFSWMRATAGVMKSVQASHWIMRKHIRAQAEILVKCERNSWHFPLEMITWIIGKLRLRCQSQPCSEWLGTDNMSLKGLPTNSTMSTAYRKDNTKTPELHGVWHLINERSASSLFVPLLLAISSQNFLDCISGFPLHF